MSIAIGDDHVALLETVRRFTADRCPPAVVRAAVDADAEALPPFWDELVALGWTALHIPEAAGGEGYGFAELAVVLEELGGAWRRGRTCRRCWASAAIGAARARAAARGPGLRSGGRVRRARAGARRRGSQRDGAVRVPARPARCCAARSPTSSSSPSPSTARALVRGRPRRAGRRPSVESLDPTRRLADVRFDDAELDPGDQLPALDRAPTPGQSARAGRPPRPRAVPRGASTRPRRTPGPQAVRPSDRAVPGGEAPLRRHARGAGAGPGAWRGTPRSRSTSADADGPRRWPAAAAGAVALDAFVKVAKDCIQVLGGIGFTWEHDAHLYLRRATAHAPAPRRRRPSGDRWRGGAGRRAPAALARPAPQRPTAPGRRAQPLVDGIAALAEGGSGVRALADAGYSCRTGRRRGVGTPGPSSSSSSTRSCAGARPRAPPAGGRRGRRRRSPRTAPSSSRSGGCVPRSSARSPGASSSASPRRGRTSRPSPPPAPDRRRLARSTVRRCGQHGEGGRLGQSGGA